ncbi:unnamed protein product, partial [Amoebophrya sp. A25]
RAASVLPKAPIADPATPDSAPKVSVQIMQAFATVSWRDRFTDVQWNALTSITTRDLAGTILHVFTPGGSAQAIAPVSGELHRPVSIVVTWAFAENTDIRHAVEDIDGRVFLENQCVDADGRLLAAALLKGFQFSLEKNQVAQLESARLGLRRTECGGEAVGDKALLKLDNMKCVATKESIQGLINSTAWEGIRDYLYAYVEIADHLRRYTLPASNKRHLPMRLFPSDEKANRYWKQLVTSVDRTLVIYPIDFSSVLFFYILGDSSKKGMSASLHGVYATRPGEPPATQEQRQQSLHGGEQYVRTHKVIRRGWTVEQNRPAKSRELRTMRIAVTELYPLVRGWPTIVGHDHQTNDPKSLEVSAFSTNVDETTKRDIMKMRPFLHELYFAWIGGTALRFADGNSRLYDAFESSELTDVPKAVQKSCSMMQHWLLNPSSRKDPNYEATYRALRDEFFDDDFDSAPGDAHSEGATSAYALGALRAADDVADLAIEHIVIDEATCQRVGAATSSKATTGAPKKTKIVLDELLSNTDAELTPVRIFFKEDLSSSTLYHYKNFVCEVEVVHAGEKQKVSKWFSAAKYGGTEPAKLACFRFARALIGRRWGQDDSAKIVDGHHGNDMCEFLIVSPLERGFSLGAVAVDVSFKCVMFSDDIQCDNYKTLSAAPGIVYARCLGHGSAKDHVAPEPNEIPASKYAERLTETRWRRVPKKTEMICAEILAGIPTKQSLVDQALLETCEPGSPAAGPVHNTFDALASSDDDVEDDILAPEKAAPPKQAAPPDQAAPQKRQQTPPQPLTAPAASEKNKH